MNVHRSGFGSLGLPSSREAPRRRVLPIVDGQPTLGAEANVVDIVRQASPYVKALVQEDDSTEDVETLRVRVRNHERLRDGYFRGSIFWVLYDNKVRVLRARLRAALARQDRDREDRASKWEWASLGKMSAVTGIAIGVAVIVMVANLAGAARRSHRGGSVVHVAGPQHARRRIA